MDRSAIGADVVCSDSGNAESRGPMHGKVFHAKIVLPWNAKYPLQTALGSLMVRHREMLRNRARCDAVTLKIVADVDQKYSVCPPAKTSSSISKAPSGWALLACQANEGKMQLKKFLPLNRLCTTGIAQSENFDLGGNTSRAATRKRNRCRLCA